MARWLVELAGDTSDLEEFPYWFPNGNISGLAEEGKYYLVGQDFELCEGASQVNETAQHFVDELSAVISLLWPGHRRPEVAGVIREEDDGKKSHYVFLSDTINLRSKVRATLSGEGEDTTVPARTQAQVLLDGAHASDRLRIALSLWGDPLHTWPRFYRILEEVEQYLGQRVSSEGFCSSSQRERFARSANSAEVAGKDARHAGGRFDAPQNPMNLGEARGFIQEILRKALQKAAMSQGEHV